MRTVNLLKLGVGIVAALMLSIAMTASASAAEFLSNKAGEKLLAEKVATQVFKINAGEVKCNTVNILAGTTVAKSTKQLALVDYEKCTAFGFIEVRISKAHYLFLASGLVHISQLIKIFTPANGCEVSVPKQTIHGVTYKNNAAKTNIIVEPNVSNIEYTQNARCAGGEGTFTNGTYSGNLEVMIKTGTVSFDP
jgi:hypothetical protein